MITNKMLESSLQRNKYIGKRTRDGRSQIIARDNCKMFIRNKKLFTLPYYDDAVYESSLTLYDIAYYSNDEETEEDMSLSNYRFFKSLNILDFSKVKLFKLNQKARKSHTCSGRYNKHLKHRTLLDTEFIKKDKGG